MTRPPLSLRPLGLLLLLAGACATDGSRPTTVAVTLTAPTADADKPVEYPGLHQVVTYAEGLVCGAVPDGDAGFESLAAMGIRSVVSVDGATPDVEAAHRHGLRYVHLPISYDGVPADRAKELATAIASVPGPIYVHCHHGKHRSASALGVAAVINGKLTAEQAQARMKVSGTAADYKGLWACVQQAKAVDPAQLRVDPKTLPEVAKVSGLVELMSAIDLVNDDCKALQQGGWQPLASHPDLVPAKSSARLHELFVAAQQDDAAKKLDARFQELLAKNAGEAKELAAAVAAGDRATADALYAAIGKGCKECHKTYRDQ